LFFSRKVFDCDMFAADEHDDIEETLRQFDMDMRYGPCIGMSRILRWERAHKMGLHPPLKVKEILQRADGTPTCLWEGRI
jgi:DNA polymerase delta subunit 4